MNFYQQQQQQQPSKPISDGEVNVPPDDTVSALSFAPQRMPQGDFVVSGTWGNTVSCYQVIKDPTANQYKGELKASHQHTLPILDVCWSDDCTKVFSASADKTVKMWDLNSNQQIQVAAHDAPIRTVHWVKTSTHTCIMTTSWDKSIRFWDTRSQAPSKRIDLNERVYCADVLGPMAVVLTADRGVSIYKLEGELEKVRDGESPFKFQQSCVSIFTNERREPTGYALGSIEGRASVQYINQKDKNFTFKAHRSNGAQNNVHEIYAVNDIAFHPLNNTMATIGSDCRYSFWDKDQRTRLKISDVYEQPLTRCCMSPAGDIFAFGIGYDWSKGHEFSNPNNKSRIIFHYCHDELQPKKKLN